MEPATTAVEPSTNTIIHHLCENNFYKSIGTRAFDILNLSIHLPLREIAHVPESKQDGGKAVEDLHAGQVGAVRGAERQEGAEEGVEDRADLGHAARADHQEEGSLDGTETLMETGCQNDSISSSTS